MTSLDSNPIFTGIRLAEAVGTGDAATIRLISTEVESAFIQENASDTFMNAFYLLNSLDGKDFPNDVWSDLPTFLINDIKDRSIMLGVREEYVSGIVGSFLTQNVFAKVEDNQPKILDPETITAGYFHIAASIGEAIYGLLKVTAEKRFEGNYQLAKSLLTDYISIRAQVTAENEALEESNE